MITSQKQLRALFWETFPEFEKIARKNKTLSKGQNSQICDCRCAFVDWVDSLGRDGQISQRLLDNATL